MNDDIDFAELGEKLAHSLVVAAEEQVSRAQQILDQTRSMAEIIRTQVAAQTKQIEAMNARFRAFGEQMLDAHRMLNGEVPAPRAADGDQLRAMVALEHSRGSLRPLAGDDTPIVDRIKQDRDANKLPGPLGSGGPGAAAVAGAQRHPRDTSRDNGAGGDRDHNPTSRAAGSYRETDRTRRD